MGLHIGVKKRMGDKAPMEFSDQDKADFRKNFNLFDKKRTGAIPIGDMGTVLRSLGQNPTEAELAALMEEVDKDKSGTIEFEEFIDLMARTNKTHEQMEEEFFRMFGAGQFSAAKNLQVASSLQRAALRGDLLPQG